MLLQHPINPIITFRNMQGEAVRGTLASLQRRSLVVEVYNPYSIIQVSEMLGALTIRSGDRRIYQGRGVVSSLVNTGLMALVTVVMLDEWFDLNVLQGNLQGVSEEADHFVRNWEVGFQASYGYQATISEFAAFLAEARQWTDQIDRSDIVELRDSQGRLRADVFEDLAAPIIVKCRKYLTRMHLEMDQIDGVDWALHHRFAQTILHPLLLGAPFVKHAVARSLGFPSDHEITNQIMGDPRQGETTYFQIINKLHLTTEMVKTYRTRIDMLVEELHKTANRAVEQGRQLHVLCIGCGAAIEVQHFIEQHPRPESICFTLMASSSVTLDHVRESIESLCERTGKHLSVSYVQGFVEQMIRRDSRPKDLLHDAKFDLIYCPSLFHYLSNYAGSRLLDNLVYCAMPGCKVIVTSLHTRSPQKKIMELLMEWYLVYRNDEGLIALLPRARKNTRLYKDGNGISVLAEFEFEAGLSENLQVRSLVPQ